MGIIAVIGGAPPTARATSGSLTADPATVDFGDVVAGQQPTIRVTLTNQSGNARHSDVSTWGALDNWDFSVSNEVDDNTCVDVVVPPGGTCEFGITATTWYAQLGYGPLGPFTGDLEIDSEAADGQSAGECGESLYIPATINIVPIDTTPPVTTLDSVGYPPVFTFSSSEPNSTFECNLDSQGWQTCTSPQSFGALTDGDHTFAVHAIDSSGNIDPDFSREHIHDRLHTA